jgi:hypothetical protein
MSKKKYLHQAVAAAFFAASAASNFAFAVDEVEPNDSIVTAQRLSFSTQTLEVFGAIGVTALNATPLPDVDFYSFQAQEGDVVSFDIDRGMKPFDMSVRSVDTLLAVFGPLPDLAKKSEHNNTSPMVPRDPDSFHVFDPLIPEFRVRTTGTYVVGVSSHPRLFQPIGGTVTSTTVTGSGAPFPNGSYKLIISGVTPVVDLVHINIEVKPGHDGDAPVNLKAQGNIPVALLSHKAVGSAPAFDAMTVNIDPGTLTFGSTGNEKTLLRCNKEGLDVDADGLLDLVCHFDNALADWEPDQPMGTVKGKTADGREFKGTGRLKIRPKTQ